MVRSRLALLLVPAAALALAASPSQEAGAFPQTRWIAANSGNYSVRSSRGIDRVVIHTVEGSEAGCISWFQNPRSNVSAHYVVSYTGRITQMVQDKDVAWHAGQWNGRSIGIENEGYAGQNRWTTAQYNALAELVRGLCDRYGIAKDRTHIVGHREVPGATHSDPGSHFDWNRLLTLVRGGNPVTTGPSTPSTGTTYVVRPGDTLSDIATRFGTTPTAIAQANGIANLSRIYPGQTLRIPGATVAPPRPTTPTAPSASSLTLLEVDADTLNVRNGVWGQVLGQVSRGQRFVASSSQSGWYRIDWRGRDAWLSGDFVKRVQGEAIVVTADALNVRSGPSTGNAAIGLIANDQAHARLGQSGDWVLVQYDQRRGWVHGNYVRRVQLS